MQLHELLDRFELLYPQNESISNLRRAYVDKDISSIFKLLDENQSVEDLKKLILGDDMWSAYRLLNSIQENPWVAPLKRFTIGEMEVNYDFLSQGQIQSKLWLIDNLKKLDLHLGTVFLCAGWYGALSLLMFENKLKIDRVRNFDSDESCKDISMLLNKEQVVDDWKYQHVIQDIHDIDFVSHNYMVKRSDGSTLQLTDTANTIINTSCEHIRNFDEWYSKIPMNKTVILQTNDYFGIEDHVNCSKSLSEFAKQTPLTTVLYEGTLNVNDTYTRMMRIGIR